MELAAIGARQLATSATRTAAPSHRPIGRVVPIRTTAMRAAIAPSPSATPAMAARPGVHAPTRAIRAPASTAAATASPNRRVLWR